MHTKIQLLACNLRGKQPLRPALGIVERNFLFLALLKGKDDQCIRDEARHLGGSSGADAPARGEEVEESPSASRVRGRGLSMELTGSSRAVGRGVPEQEISGRNLESQYNVLHGDYDTNMRWVSGDTSGAPLEKHRGGLEEPQDPDSPSWHRCLPNHCPAATA